MGVEAYDANAASAEVDESTTNSTSTVSSTLGLGLAPSPNNNANSSSNNNTKSLRILQSSAEEATTTLNSSNAISSSMSSTSASSDHEDSTKFVYTLTYASITARDAGAASFAAPDFFDVFIAALMTHPAGAAAVAVLGPLTAFDAASTTAIDSDIVDLSAAA